MQAEQITPTEWRVTDDEGTVHRVFLPAGRGAEDAIATLDQARNPVPPTPEEAAEERAAAIKAECRAAILAVVDETAQGNIAQAGVIYAAMRTDGADAATARAAVGLVEGDLTTAAAWKAWVTSMQAECRRAITDGDDPVWPDVPDGVAEMAARF